MDDTRVAALTAALGACTALETLDLVGLDLSDAAAAALVRALPAAAAATLVRLSLAENAAAERTAAAVCERLLAPRGTALAVLDLFANRVGDRAAAALAAALTHNTTVRVLNLGRLQSAHCGVADCTETHTR